MKRYERGRWWRYGYTTGTCAAAAALAAARLLLFDERLAAVTIHTPKGWPVTVEIVHLAPQGEGVLARVIKDAGDDPDLTHGMPVEVWVKRRRDTGLVIKGGEGVGVVTKPGLAVPVGACAINPVPRRMIAEALERVVAERGSSCGLEATVGLPQGRALASRTFNPRLGIEGGLSVLGTTGIVEPMSEEAFKESLFLEMAQKKAPLLALVPGNLGRDHLLGAGLGEEQLVKTSNFIGAMAERAVALGVERVLLAGHVGKLVKVAGGIYHTHNRVADGRLSTLVDHLVHRTDRIDFLQAVSRMMTMEEAAAALAREGLGEVFDDLAKSAKERLEIYTGQKLVVEVILYTYERGCVGQTSGVPALLNALKGL